MDFETFTQHFPAYIKHYTTSLRHLSGGEARLVEVYAIIKGKAQFAMLDEPFTHIMPLHIEKIKELLQEEKEKKGFLITDHMYLHIVDIADELYLFIDGKVHIAKALTILRVWDMHGFRIFKAGK